MAIAIGVTSTPGLPISRASYNASTASRNADGFTYQCGVDRDRAAIFCASLEPAQVLRQSAILAPELRFDATLPPSSKVLQARARLLRWSVPMTDSQTASAPVTTTAVKARLLSDHRELEELLAQLTCAVEGTNPTELCEQWTQFEQNLRDHLDTEERCLFPLVASAHRDDVERLRAEHQHIRSALSDLGVAVDLHTLRKTSVDELIIYLQQHALREDHSLYQWLDDGVAAQRGLRAMFERRASRGRDIG